jgi:Core-2/I-Branching enzyme
MGVLGGHKQYCSLFIGICCGVIITSLLWAGIHIHKCTLTQIHVGHTPGPTHPHSQTQTQTQQSLGPTLLTTQYGDSERDSDRDSDSNGDTASESQSVTVSHSVESDGAAAGTGSTGESESESESESKSESKSDVSSMSTIHIVKSSDTDASDTGRRLVNVNDLDGINLAFFVSAHRDTLRLLPRLMSRIYHCDNVYIIHFDQRVKSAKVTSTMTQVYTEIASIMTASSSISDSTMLSMPCYNDTMTKPSNIIVMKERQQLHRQHISLVFNLLAGISEAIQLQHTVRHTVRHRPTKWSYLINLSASDYPLVAPTQLRRLLARKYETLLQHFGKGLEFVSLMDKPEHFFNMRMPAVPHDSISAPFIARGHAAASISIPLNDDGKIEASQLDLHKEKAEYWGIWSKEFCEWLTYSTTAKRLLMLLSGMNCIDEHYMITALLNAHQHPEFVSTIANSRALRFICWDNCAGSPRTPKQISAGHPLTLDKNTNEAALLRQMRLHPAAFARKFRSPTSRILDVIDHEFSGIASAAVATGSGDGGGQQGHDLINRHAVDEYSSLLSQYYDTIVDTILDDRANELFTDRIDSIDAMSNTRRTRNSFQ